MALRNLHLLAYAPQMAAYGGMERHICLVTEAAARMGARVTLLTPAGVRFPNTQYDPFGSPVTPVTPCVTP